MVKIKETKQLKRKLKNIEQEQEGNNNAEEQDDSQEVNNSNNELSQIQKEQNKSLNRQKKKFEQKSEEFHQKLKQDHIIEQKKNIELIYGKEIRYEYQIFYGCKWIDIPYQQMTFEPLENLEGNEELIEQYENYHSKNLFWDFIQKGNKPQISLKINPFTITKSSLENMKANQKIKKPGQRKDGERKDGESLNEQNLNQEEQKKEISSENQQIHYQSNNTNYNKSSVNEFQEQFPNIQNVEKPFSEYKKELMSTTNQSSQLLSQRNGNLYLDIPLRIEKHKIKIDKDQPQRNKKVLYFKVIWAQRQDGTQMNPTYYRYEQIEEKYPRILLKYFYDNSVLYQNDLSSYRTAKNLIKKEEIKQENTFSSQFIQPSDNQISQISNQ